MKIQVTQAVETFDRDIIEFHKDDTRWFNPENPQSRKETYDLFRNICQFSNAESLVLVAALGMVGAQFEDDVIVMNEDDSRAYSEGVRA